MKFNFKSVLNVLQNNWATKILSLLIAIIIWLLIVQYVNPDDTRRLDDIKIQLQLTDSVPAAEGLVLVTDFDETLSIVYKASRDVIAVLNTDKIIAYVDLSSATNSGAHSYPIKIDTGGQNITIVEQSMTEAVLEFEKSATAQIKVNVLSEGEVPEGYVKNDPVCVPSVINIEGPESQVNSIVSAEVKISEKEFSKSSVYNCDYEFVDQNGEKIDKKYITTDCEKVDVTVTVLKTKVLPVTATIINSSGGHDNMFSEVTISPANITIAGGEETLETLNSYDLGTIDVADKTDDFSSEYVISLQNGIKNVDGVSTVDVSVKFGDVVTKTIKFDKFYIQNLPENQKAVVTDKSISITFRGITADIEKLNPTNVKIAIDFNNKAQSKGINSVPVYAVLPDNFKVGVSGKYYATVNITK